MPIQRRKLASKTSAPSKILGLAKDDYKPFTRSRNSLSMGTKEKTMPGFLSTPEAAQKLATSISERVSSPTRNSHSPTMETGKGNLLSKDTPISSPDKHTRISDEHRVNTSQEANANTTNTSTNIDLTEDSTLDQAQGGYDSSYEETARNAQVDQAKFNERQTRRTLATIQEDLTDQYDLPPKGHRKTAHKHSKEYEQELKIEELVKGIAMLESRLRAQEKQNETLSQQQAQMSHGQVMHKQSQNTKPTTTLAHRQPILHLPKPPRWETPRYSGNKDEDFDQFLVELKEYHAAYDWPPTMQASQLGMMLKDRAKLFYQDFTNSEKADFSVACEKLKNKFGSETKPATDMFKLIGGSQNVGQTVAEYSYKVAKNIRKANITDPKLQVAIFMNGLKPSLQAKLVERSPSTLEEAEQLADIFETSAQLESRNIVESVQLAIDQLNETTKAVALLNNQAKDTTQPKQPQQPQQPQQRNNYRNNRGNSNKGGNPNYKGKNYNPNHQQQPRQGQWPNQNNQQQHQQQDAYPTSFPPNFTTFPPPQYGYQQNIPHNWNNPQPQQPMGNTQTNLPAITYPMPESNTGPFCGRCKENHPWQKHTKPFCYNCKTTDHDTNSCTLN